jgi:hypothetical protein
MDAIDLGCWETILRKAETCAFCRLVECAIQRLPRRLPARARLYLRNEESWRKCVVYAPYGKPSERYSTTKEIKAAVRASSGEKAYRFLLYRGAGGNEPIAQFQHIPPPKSQPKARFFGRQVGQRYANLSLINSWLPRCSRVHGTLCDESGNAARRLPNIRVIDVHKRVVILAPPMCRYIALSYVWGNNNEQFLTMQNDIDFDESGNEFINLPDQLPQTIEDAIYTTRELGEDYLWVDALCIIQDNATDKHSQMLHMDAIYNSAYVTIAAASGNSANSGLPGISRPRAVSQIIENVDRLQFTIPLPTYMDLESDPSIYWNSRGWTFQEKILSKRLLVFTDYQVYFQCSNMVWCEDTAMETDGCPEGTSVNWKPLRWAADRTPRDLGDVGINIHTVIGEIFAEKLPRFLPFRSKFEALLSTMGFDPQDVYSEVSRYLSRKETLGRITEKGKLTAHSSWATDRQMGQIALLAMNRVTFKAYTSAIEEFTRRTVSHREDAIHAVQGVLGTLTVQFGTFHSGLPEDYSAAALLWDTLSLSEARCLLVTEAPFPSWSWARWHHPDGCRWQTPKVSKAKLEQAFLLTPSGFVSFSTPAGRVAATPPRIARNKLETSSLLNDIGHLLCIYSSTINFYIGRCMTPPSTSTQEDQLRDRIHEYQLLDRDHVVIGHIRMSKSERRACGSRAQALQSICSSIGYDGNPVGRRYIPTKLVSHGEDMPSTREDMRPDEYPVMHAFLLRWEGDIAERVALGHVVKEAWISRRSRWILIG